MVALFLSALFWSVFATVMACVEIEIEGRYGWAQKLPTWYRTIGFCARAFGFVTGGKPLTGYHAFMFFLPVMIFHAPFVMGAPWSLAAELGTWALYFVWCPLWDYFWFVLNLYYVGKFKRGHVWWHARSPWLFGLFPFDYLMGTAASLAFAGLAAWASGSATRFRDHLILIG